MPRQYSASIGLYGNPQIGFGCLCQWESPSQKPESVGYSPTGQMGYPTPTSAIFAAADFLASKGVTGWAHLTEESVTRYGEKTVNSADLEIDSPRAYGSLKFKGHVV